MAGLPVEVAVGITITVWLLILSRMHFTVSEEGITAHNLLSGIDVKWQDIHAVYTEDIDVFGGAGRTRYGLSVRTLDGRAFASRATTHFGDTRAQALSQLLQDYAPRHVLLRVDADLIS